MNAAPIKNLVFEGGGVKGTAYAGVLEVLSNEGHYDGIENVAGASAGSITASILAAGAGSAGLSSAILNTDFGEFIFDRGGLIGDIARISTHYGLHTGNQFVEIIRSLFEQHSGNADITFAELEQNRLHDPAKFKRLSIVASNLNQQRAQVFDSTSHPNLPIWKAVRCSISIPVVFEPFEVDGCLYVDGGLSWNYPIDLFDDSNIRNPETVGLYLENHDAALTGKAFEENQLIIDGIGSFVEALTSFMYETANKRHIHPEDRDRTVFIDDLSISGADFHTSKDRLNHLIESGKTATAEFLKQRFNT